MCTSRYAYQAPSSMLRARRRDANVRPNRWLDKKSSRGMLFENEELRLRTIEINAEVERGQGDIKKLKRQNEQLRREIWSLRDEYDKLEERMRRMRGSGACSSCEEDEIYRDNEEEDEEDICSDELEEKEQEKLGGAEDDDNRQNAHLASAKLGYTEDKPYEPQTIEEKTSLTPDATPEQSDPGEPPDLQRVDRGQPDLLVLPSQNACNSWQASAPSERRLSEVDRMARGCDDCFEHRSTLRCSARRRSANGVQGSDGVYVDARLSLPVGAALESKQQNSEVVGSESSTIPVSDPEPWWLLAPVNAADCDAECGCEMSDSQAWHQQQNAQWIPHAQSPVWAVAPYRAGDAQLPQSPFAARTRRRAPPPPPPKPTCEQIATVHRASSILPDGTTRRSVTFHADSVTYIPPPPPPPQLDNVNYIPPVMNAVSPCQDPDNRTCLCSLHSQPLLGCDGEDTTLVVRGLERIPNLASRELIDALEQRLGPTLLRQSVRGVCLHQARPSANVVAATVSIAQRDVALRLLVAGLEARGESLQLEEEEALSGAAGTRWRRGSEDQNAGHMLLVSGVTHQVSDSAVRAAVLRASGLRACQVRRHVYKGVDTGERLVRVTSPCLSLISPKQQSSIENGSSEADQVSSSDESKYRSHISVQLRRPEEFTEDAAPTRNLNSASNDQNSRAVVRPANLQLPGVTHVRTPGSPPGTPRHVTRNNSLQLAPLSPDSPILMIPSSPQVRSPQLCNGPLSPPPYTPPPAPPSRAGPTAPLNAPAVPARRPSIQAPAKTTALVENTVTAPREGESPTKQRASVNFEERPSGANTGVKKKASHGQQNGILRRGDETQGRKAGKSRSVSVESSRVGSGPQRRRHGVFERPSSEELLLEGRGSLSSSREGSGSRQLTVIPPSGGSLPWCACWGNGCI